MSQETKWRVGIIGAGTIVRYAHIPDFQRIDGVEVVSIADVNHARAAELAAEQDIAHVYDDYRVMLDEQPLDIVVVATPNIFHRQMATDALESGAHVLCEKPDRAYLCRCPGDRRESHGQRACPDRRHSLSLFRGDPGRTRRQADAGFFGASMPRRTLWQRRAGIPGFGSWFTRQELAGGGALLDIGVHALDRALYLMGFPKPVAVTGATFAEFGPRALGLGGWGMDIAARDANAIQFDVDDLAWATIRFADGSVLQLQVAWAAHSPEQFYTELYGTEGGGRIERNEGVDLFTDINGGPADIKLPLPTQRTGTYRILIENFVRHLNGDPSAQIVTPDEALISVQIIDAIQRSATTGREVVLE